MGNQMRLVENYPAITQTFYNNEKKINTLRLDLGMNTVQVKTEAEEIYNAEVVEKVGMDEFPEELFNTVLEYFISDGKIREAMMMICAANFGMRFSDVRQIKVSHLVDIDGEFRTKFYINEQKTTKTRPFYINDAVKTAMCIYWKKYKNSKKYNDYLFTADGNNKKYVISNGEKVQTPLSHTQFESALKSAMRDIGVKLKNDYTYQGGDIKLNTHSFRKLYGGKFCRTCSKLIREEVLDVDLFAIQLLQLDFSHTSMATTQRYCGELERAKSIVVNHMNLGLEVVEKYL